MRKAIVLGVVLLAACASSQAPPSGDLGTLAERSPGPLYNNCTYNFVEGCDITVHPDSFCIESRVGGGYSIQAINRIHCSIFEDCPNGEGDASAIRLCNRYGIDHDLETPCGPTGPNGCAACWDQITCE